MQKDTNVTLDVHYEQFIAQQIAAGRFGSVSETIQAGLRLLEEDAARLEALRQALIEGEESGIAADFSFEKLNRKLDAELGN